MGIDNYYFNNIDGKLVPDNYWDFHLTSDNQGMSLPYATSCFDDCDLGIITGDDLVVWFDVSKSGTTTDGSVLCSLVEWTGSTITPSSGMTLSDFGLTGIDNGRVTGFTDTLIITSADTKIQLYPVTGYTIQLVSGATGSTYVTSSGKYVYPWTYLTGTTVGTGCQMEESVCLNGGFYQGFFKIDFEDPAPYSATTITNGSSCASGITTTIVKGDPDAQKYEIFPTTFEKGWTMETWLYPNTTCDTTPTAYTTFTDGCDLPTNNTIYVTESGEVLIRVDDDCISGFQFDADTGTTVTSVSGGMFGSENILNAGNTVIGFSLSGYKECGVGDCPTGNTTCGTLINVSSTTPITTLSNIIISDCDNNPIPMTFLSRTDSSLIIPTSTLNDTYSGNTGFFFYIGTRAENKFQNVFSGESGYTTTTNLPLQPNITVDEGLNGGQDWFSISEANTIGGFNPFRNCDCVCPITGSTSSITSGSSNTYCNQLGENALGFRITDDNKLGWRKVSVTGECRNNKFTITGNTIEEEYTTTSVIPTGNTPTLIQVVYVQGGEKNGLPAGTLKMFVNGRLVLKSKEFIGIQLRALNTWSDKQQGVPYNMSWGGGTQGLAESQTFGGPDPADSSLLLEQNFAGSFLGQLSQLRFYKRPFNVLELRNNLFSECGRYCVRSTFGGSQIIQPGSSLCSDCSSGNLPPYC